MNTTTAAVILAAFKEGLAAEGMTVSEEAEVRYGYLGSLLARATLPLEVLGRPGEDDVKLFEQRVRLTRTLVDLVSPIK